MLEIINSMDNVIELKKLQKKLSKVGWIVRTEYESDKKFIYNTQECRIFVDIIEEKL